MSSVKEPKFFLANGRPPRHKGPGDERACAGYVYERGAYEALFNYPDAAPSYAGEASPYYLWDDDAASQIKQVAPDARLIAVLREPSRRAYSNWADLKEQGREKLSFADALAAEKDREQDDWEPFWFYRSLGMYGEQLTKLYSIFPREQVKVVLFEDLREAPQSVLDEIFAFLGLADFVPILETTPMNQTMYAPGNRRARAALATFTLGERARPVVPKAVRRLARGALQNVLRESATASFATSSLIGECSGLFDEDRHVIERLGIDVPPWEP